MRCIKGICKQCKTEVKFDIGDMPFDEAWDKLKEIQSFECPGYHYYIAGIIDHYDWEEIDV